MTKKEIEKILSSHKLWIDGKSKGKRANLRGADLRGADLRGADLQRAYIQEADIQGANLQEANLQGANLWGANLRGANLQEANLQGAYIQEADIQGAVLPAPTMLLLANWGDLSEKTTLALMRLDCSAHPAGHRAFDEWAAEEGSDCPYTDCRFQRVARFAESKELWSYGRPPTIWMACKMVLGEKCPGWDKKLDD